MNRERAAALLPIIKAFAEGKEIQVRNHNGTWRSSSRLDKRYDEYSFDVGDLDYRVKPEPVLRPWLSSEVPKYFIARETGTTSVYLLGQHKHGLVFFQNSNHFMDLDRLCRYWLHVHEDGSESPCGVLEEPKD